MNGTGQPMTDDRRPTGDRRSPGPTGDRPPVQFASRLGGGDRTPLIPIVALALLVGIAALSSGQAAPGTADRVASSTAAAALAPASLSPSSQSNSQADPDVATICLEPASWRSATIETWRDQTVRVWRAIDPVTASGPDDPAIPIVPAVGSRVAAIGFCAPVVGPDRPTGPVTVEAWRRDLPAGEGAGATPGSGAQGTTATVPLQLRSVVPAGSPSPFGALFGPPAGSDTGTGWTQGIIVFRYAQAASGATTAATWFAIEISLTDAAGKPARTSAPTIATPEPAQR
jgi:hypothetical protein